MLRWERRVREGGQKRKMLNTLSVSEFEGKE